MNGNKPSFKNKVSKNKAVYGFLSGKKKNFKRS
jgi:hypothetical protein